MKNMEVWERFFHGGKPMYGNEDGFRKNTGIHEEYHRDFSPLGCITKKAHIKLRNENFYE